MSPHEKLFEQYCEELRHVKIEVDAWWSDLFKREQQSTQDLKQAVREVKRRWPAGPASHPLVVAVIRKYYLACLALNESLEDEGGDEAQPVVFLTEWMLDGAHEDLIDFLRSLSYWPVGFDDEGDIT